MQKATRVTLAVLWLSAASVATAQTTRPGACPSRPPVEGVDAVIDGAEQLTMRLQGRVQFEGDRRDARPLPPTTLWNLTEDLSRALERSRKARLINRDALYFALHADTSPSREREVFSASKSTLWCVVQRGDTVLLSDGPTSHFTRVWSVNRETGYVYLLDLWPERFPFLKQEGVNSYKAVIERDTDVTARFQGPLKLVRVPRQEFEKTLVGVITLGTPDFVDYYLRAAPPGAAQRAETQLTLGLALLHEASDRFVDQSIPPLERATELFRSARRVKEEAYSASRLHLARMIQYYQRQLARDVAGLAATVAGLDPLWARYGKEQLLSTHDPLDLCRLGRVAVAADDLNSGAMFLTRAIEAKADYEEAFLYRAAASYRKADSPADVIIDATRALKLNDQARATLVKQKLSRHARDVIGQDRDRDTGDALDERKVLALRMRGPSLRQMRSASDALKDGQALVELRPAEAFGYQLVGFAEMDLGDTVEGRRNLERAAQLETDPILLKLLKDTLAKQP
jgi:tetratricopeptide (TPR) repeat protein